MHWTIRCGLQFIYVCIWTMIRNLYLHDAKMEAHVFPIGSLQKPTSWTEILIFGSWSETSEYCVNNLTNTVAKKTKAIFISSWKIELSWLFSSVLTLYGWNEFDAPILYHFWDMKTDISFVNYFGKYFRNFVYFQKNCNISARVNRRYVFFSFHKEFHPKGKILSTKKQTRM